MRWLVESGSKQGLPEGLPALLCCLAVGVAVVHGASVGHAADVHLVPAERWSTRFGGEEIRMVMKIRSDEVIDGTLHWVHTTEGRILSRGQVDIAGNGRRETNAEFVLRTSALREGVIVATRVTTEFVSRGSDRSSASNQSSLWLFSDNPLAGRAEWARGLDIQLFDPTGSTAAKFDAIGLPCTRLHSEERLADSSSEGVFVVGEGTSLRSHPSLAATLLKKASAGRTVVLLSPSEGSLSIPGLTDNRRETALLTGEVRLARQHIITELDKRLDHLAWAGAADTIPARGIVPDVHRGLAVAGTSSDPHAWPWAEVRFPDSGGVLVVCGFCVIEHWSNSPTPGYLLVRLLESLSLPDADTQVAGF